MTPSVRYYLFIDNSAYTGKDIEGRVYNLSDTEALHARG
jgi:hypothetical protein